MSGALPSSNSSTTPHSGPSREINAPLSNAMRFVNAGIVKISIVAILLTAVILTYSVVSRYLFNLPTDWQDEASVFMLIGITFSCAAYVQAGRGHIGIEILSSVLSPRTNRVRLFLVDLVSFVFCGFFSWKSWTLCHEAWVEGQTTSSTFAPPLWIPYAMMAFGMTLLTVQILVQLIDETIAERKV